MRPIASRSRYSRRISTRWGYSEWVRYAALAILCTCSIGHCFADEIDNANYYGNEPYSAETTEELPTEELVTEQTDPEFSSSDEEVSTASPECKPGAHCPGVCRDAGRPHKPLIDRPGDRDRGDCPPLRYRIDDCRRSGDPSSVYIWAKPSITDKYSAWYVGGGAWFKGRGRTAEEGTWGLDYDGAFGHARTWLNYTCGKRKGGEGAYQTDHVSIKAKLSSLH